MYTAPQKRFRPRDEAKIFEAIKRCSALYGGGVRRVFLADGVTPAPAATVTLLNLPAGFATEPSGVGKLIARADRDRVIRLPSVSLSP
jgi:hypothetical protein